EVVNFQAADLVNFHPALTKFIIDALKKLTVTVVSTGNGLKKRFYSNFNEVNRAILADFLSET
ncbi:MAG TPA: hypothetical protein PLY24_01515, partial [Methanomassiliicoccales archaeon]|nr:hypothetical protein [Methanomassiliicoccales archaeon]